MVEKSQWFLGIETSTSHGSMTLAQKGHQNLVLKKSWSRTHSHSEIITIYAEELFERAQIKPSQLDGIATGVGPGSFTGIRVAINFARALAYANQIPLWTLNTLENLALCTDIAGRKLLVGGEAFRDLIYIGVYELNQGRVLTEIFPPKAITVEEIIENIDFPCIAAGQGLLQYWDELFPIHNSLTKCDILYPDSDTLLAGTAMRSNPPRPNDWKSAKPLYIRASEAEEKLKSGDLKPQNPKR